MMEELIINLAKEWGPASATVIVVVLFLRDMRYQRSLLQEILTKHMTHCAEALEGMAESLRHSR
jgi:hypothetical protein